MPYNEGHILVPAPIFRGRKCIACHTLWGRKKFVAVGFKYLYCRTISVKNQSIARQFIRHIISEQFKN